MCNLVIEKMLQQKRVIFDGSSDWSIKICYGNRKKTMEIVLNNFKKDEVLKVYKENTILPTLVYKNIHSIILINKRGGYIVDIKDLFI